MRPYTDETLEKYEYLRRLIATSEIAIAMTSTDATTPEELEPYMPEILAGLSEYHAALVQEGGDPEFLKCVISQKNRKIQKAHAIALKESISELLQSIENGRPLVAIFDTPAELVHAVGAQPMMMENIALFLSTAPGGGVNDELDESAADGFPAHMCSMQKAPFGAMKKGKIPRPALMTKCASPCSSSSMYYQYGSVRHDIPLFSIDFPTYTDDKQKISDFMYEQMLALVAKLEETTGNKLDEDILREYVEHGNEYLSYYFKLQELRKIKPCPDTAFHRPQDAAGILQLGVSKGNLGYIKACYEEAKARADKGLGVIPESKEEIRTLWTYGIIGLLAPVYDWLEEEFGATFIGDTISYYPEHVAGYVDTTNLESMLRGLGLRAMNLPMARQNSNVSDIYVGDMVRIATECDADAAVFSGNHACKTSWAAAKRVNDALIDLKDIPSLVFEMDFVDPRTFPVVTAKTMLSEFFSTFQDE